MVRDDGAVVPGPRENKLFSSAEPVAWSLAVTPDHTLYVGTGYNARLLRIKNGVSRVLYEGPEVAITALSLAPDGTLYAGVSPGGRVYRFAPNGKREILLQTRETFVHALQWTPQGLYVATGGPRAALYRVENPEKVAPNTAQKPLTVLPQTHLTSVDANGSEVYVGAGDDAVLYRVDAQSGAATALYQATNPQAANGMVTVAGATQTQVIVINADGVPNQTQTQTPGVVGSNSPLLRRGGLTGGNEITGIAATQNGVYFGTLTSGSVYQWTARRGVEEFWKSAGQSIYALRSDGDNLYVGCDGGEVWRLSGQKSDVRAARVLDASQPQVLALAQSGPTLYAATANNAAVYQIGAPNPKAAAGEYDSDIYDAKQLVAWGALRSIGDNVSIQTRSGNTVDPDATWSAWQPLSDGSIVSPPGRYLQYRANFGEQGNLTRVEALYRAPNRAPVVKWTIPAGGEFLSGKQTLAWNGTDPDADPLRYSVEIAPLGGEFKVLPDVTPTDAKIEVDTLKFADGIYRARVTASDAARNANDRQSDVALSLPFTVDNTAPDLGEINLTRENAGWNLGARATDATSPLAGAEWRIKPDDDDAKKTDAKKADVTVKTDDGKTDAVTQKADAKAADRARSAWQALTTVDGLFDGKTELLVGLLDPAFAPAPLQSGMKIEVRLRDAAGNSTMKTVVLP